VSHNAWCIRPTDIVVWQHDCFQRNQQDLIKGIKRTKKTKNSKPPSTLPPEVRINSPSVSDEADSLPCPGARPVDSDRGWWESEFAKIAVQNKCLETKILAQSTKISEQNSWWEAEFTNIAKQNKCLEKKISEQSTKIAEQSVLLEKKLECLLQLTLQISPASSFENVAPGVKRCRTSPVLSHVPPRHRGLKPTPYHHHEESSQRKTLVAAAASYRHSPAHHPPRLVYEDQKVCDDDYGIGQAIGNDLGPALHRGRGVEQARNHYEMNTLGPVREDQKICDDDQYWIAQAADNDVFKPAPHQGYGVEQARHCKMESPEPVCKDQKIFDDKNHVLADRKDQEICNDKGHGNVPAGDHYNIEPAPYRSDEASPRPPSPAAANRKCEIRDDPMTKFIDIMLSEEEPEEDAPNTGMASPAESPDDKLSSSDTTPLLCDCGNNDDILDDILMEEALDSLTSEPVVDANRNLLASCEDVADPVAQLSSSNSLGRLISTANRAMDKTDGPQLVRSSSSEVPVLPRLDVENGYLPVGVTVVAAQAELVQEGNVDPNTERHRRGERRDRRKVIYLLAFIALVLSAGVTYTAVWASRKADADEAKKMVSPRAPIVLKPCQKRGGCPRDKEDVLFDEVQNATGSKTDVGVADDPSKEWESARAKSAKTSPSRNRRKKERPGDKDSLFDTPRNDALSSFSFMLGGKNFVCNPVSS